MAEGTPRRECQLSKSKEELRSGWGGKLLHENPGEVASNLGCTTTVVQWWVGKGALRKAAMPPSWPL